MKQLDGNLKKLGIWNANFFYKWTPSFSKNKTNLNGTIDITFFKCIQTYAWKSGWLAQGLFCELYSAMKKTRAFNMANFKMNSQVICQMADHTLNLTDLL